MERSIHREWKTDSNNNNKKKGNELPCFFFPNRWAFTKI